MDVTILSLFPEMFQGPLTTSLIGKAREKGLLNIEIVNFRDYATNKFHHVDDTPYGGGMGMLLMAEPIAACLDDLMEQLGKRPHILFMSPQGKTLTQKRVRELAQMENLVILCGHYEGVDDRVLQAYVDEEISLGDFVLTANCLPSLWRTP